MRAKRFSLLSVLLIVALLLAACGPSGGTETAEEAAPPAQEEQAEQEEAPAAAEEETDEEASAAEASEDAPAAMGARTGAWIDEVIAVEEPSAAAAVTRMDVGEIDAYAFSISDAEVFATVQGMDILTYSNSFGV